MKRKDQVRKIIFSIFGPFLARCFLLSLCGVCLWRLTKSYRGFPIWAYALLAIGAFLSLCDGILSFWYGIKVHGYWHFYKYIHWTGRSWFDPNTLFCLMTIVPTLACTELTIYEARQLELYPQPTTTTLSSVTFATANVTFPNEITTLPPRQRKRRNAASDSSTSAIQLTTALPEAMDDVINFRTSGIDRATTFADNSTQSQFGVTASATAVTRPSTAGSSDVTLQPLSDGFRRTSANTNENDALTVSVTEALEMKNNDGDDDDVTVTSFDKNVSVGATSPAFRTAISDSGRAQTTASIEPVTVDTHENTASGREVPAVTGATLATDGMLIGGTTNVLQLPATEKLAVGTTAVKDDAISSAPVPMQLIAASAPGTMQTVGSTATKKQVAVAKTALSSASTEIVDKTGAAQTEKATAAVASTGTNSKSTTVQVTSTIGSAVPKSDATRAAFATSTPGDEIAVNATGTASNVTETLASEGESEELLWRRDTSLYLLHHFTCLILVLTRVQISRPQGLRRLQLNSLSFELLLHATDLDNLIVDGLNEVSVLANYSFFVGVMSIWGIGFLVMIFILSRRYEADLLHSDRKKLDAFYHSVVLVFQDGPRLGLRLATIAKTTMMGATPNTYTQFFAIKNALCLALYGHRMFVLWDRNGDEERLRGHRNM